jgi:peptide/nickel transport system substrate-binding protein
MQRTRVIGVLLAVCALAACTRGTARKKGAAKAGVDAPVAAASNLPADWLEGRLPPSVLEGTPRQGGTLVVRMQAEPPSLDQITDSDQITTWILDRKVYQGLARLDGGKAPDYPLKPELAESWEISPDGQTYTFHIRHGVKWHDGALFSGQDVVATVHKILDPSMRSMHLRGQFEDLESIRTAPGDDFTVVAHYKRPYFLALRSLATLSIYPKHVLDRAGDMLTDPIHRAPVGTGPFQFETWDTANKKLVFVRNEQYWGRKARVDRLVYRFVEDASVAFQLLQKGEFDVFTQLQEVAWTKDMPTIPALVEGYHRSRFFEVNYSWIGWNNARPFFKDPRVRLAMTYAMDRDGMLRNFLYGINRSTTCIFYNESSSCDHALQPRPFDPAKAAALLDEAGWTDHDGDGLRDKDGVPAKFTFLAVASSQFFAKLTPYLQQELRKIGVQMDIRKVEWSIYIKTLRDHEFDACGLLWGNTDVQEDPFSVWHSSMANAGSNYISYANPEADRLLVQARAELDDARRNELYRRFGHILYDENPYTFLYNRPALDAIRRSVHGLRAQVPWYDFEDAWFAEAQDAAK